jgi:hypothetical protein
MPAGTRQSQSALAVSNATLITPLLLLALDPVLALETRHLLPPLRVSATDTAVRFAHATSRLVEATEDSTLKAVELLVGALTELTLRIEALPTWGGRVGALVGERVGRRVGTVVGLWEGVRVGRTARRGGGSRWPGERSRVGHSFAWDGV